MSEFHEFVKAALLARQGRLT